MGCPHLRKHERAASTSFSPPPHPGCTKAAPRPDTPQRATAARTRRRSQTLLSWAYLRLYCFPRYIIASILLDTSANYDFLEQIFGTRVTHLVYSVYLVPLLSLLVLHCFWYASIVNKVLKELKGGGKRGKAA